MFYRITALLTALSILLFGCLSEEEKQARRDNAFDISGSWQTEESSEVQFNFEITNQTAKHDISVTLTRTNPVTEKEKQLLQKAKTDHGITSEDILNPPTQITFGGESDPLGDYLDGGDNISDNFGKSSKFYVCDDNPAEYESTKTKTGKKAIKIKTLYCLSGTIKKESKTLIEEGELSLAIIQNYENAEGDGFGIETEGEVSFKYKAQKASP